MADIEKLLDDAMKTNPILKKKKLYKTVKKDLEKYPLLSKAVYIGCEKAVDELLKRGVNIDIQTEDGKTPLMIAIEKGNIMMVHKLLNKGASIAMRNENGMNALMTAVSKRDIKAFSLLWKFLDKNDVSLLNTVDSNGQTVLLLAVDYGLVECVDLLAESPGIMLNKQGTDGKSALMIAVAKGHLNIIETLLRAGANVLLEDKLGETALCSALLQEQAKLIGVILSKLTIKDQSSYVKGRIVLLEAPKNKYYQEIVAFYKNVLFRVLLQVQRFFQNGLELFMEHKLFFALLKCAQTFQFDTELLCIVFHLSACVLYNGDFKSDHIAPNATVQYVEAKGLDFSLCVVLSDSGRDSPNVRGAAFLPIHACANTTAGRLWLVNNYSELYPYVEDFKTIFPVMRFWLKIQSVKVEILFQNFENTMKEIHDAVNRVSITDQLSENQNKNTLKFPSDRSGFQVLSKERMKRESSRPFTLERKNNTEEPKIKLKNITFYSRLPTVPNDILPGKNSIFTPTFDQTMTSSCQTGYADALKRNMHTPSKPIISKSPENLRPFSKVVEKKTLTPTKHDFIEHKRRENHKKNTFITLQNTYDTDVLKTPTNDTNSASNKKETPLTESLKNEQTPSMKTKLKEFCSRWIPDALRNNPIETLMFLVNMYYNNVSVDKSSFKKSFHESHRRNSTHKNKEDMRNEDSPIENYFTSSEKDKPQELNAFPNEVNSIKMVPNNNHSNLKIPGHASSKHAEETSTDLKKQPNGKKRERKRSVLELLEKAGKMNQDNFKSSNNQSCEYSLKIKPNFEEISKTTHVMTYSEVTKITCNNILTADMEQSFDNSSKKISDNLLPSKSEILEVSKQNVVTDQSSEIKKSIEKFKGMHFLDSMKSLNSESEHVDNIDKRKRKDISDCNKKEIYISNKSTEIIGDITEAHDKVLSRKQRNISSCKLAIKFSSPLVNLTSNKNIKSNKNLQFKNLSKENGVINVQNMQLNPTTMNNSLNNLHLINKNMHKKSVLDPFYASHKNSEKQFCKINTLQKKLLTLPIKGTFFNDERIDQIFRVGKRDSSNVLYGMFLLKTCESLKEKSVTIEAIRSRIVSMNSSNTPLVDSSMKSVNLSKYLALYHSFIHRSIDIYCSKSVKEFESCNRLPKDALIETGQNIFRKKAYFSMNYQGDAATLVDLKSKYFRNSKELIHQISEHIKKEIFSNENGNISPPLLTTSCEEHQEITIEEISSKDDNIHNRKENKVGVKDSENNYIAGYLPKFTNIEVQSKWSTVVKNIHSCIPLAYFLLQTQELKTRERMTLRRINTSEGTVVYSTTLDYTLGDGDFGTYVGLLDQSGFPVVVREIKLSSDIQKEEIKSLNNKRHLMHNNIVKFFGTATDNFTSKVCLVSELCEFNISEYLKIAKKVKNCKALPLDGKFLIADLIEGIRYLHSMQIIHGFLKPSNLMVTLDNRLKLADCFLSDSSPLIWGERFAELHQKPIGTSVSSYSWRPSELIAARNEQEARESICPSSDIQMVGMLSYFILSGGKHPFGSTDETCQNNIKMGCPVFRSEPMEIEAKKLISEMIEGEKTKRPTIINVIKHPYFWSQENRFQFLVRIGRRLSIYDVNDFKADQSQGNIVSPKTKTSTYIFKTARVIDEFRKKNSEVRDWISYVPQCLMIYLSKSTNTLFTNDYVDLLRFSVALQDHFETMPLPFKQMIFKPSRFILHFFPQFFMSVYETIRSNPILQIQLGLQNLF